MEIRFCDTDEYRAAANALIARQYASRGYGAHALPDGPNQISLVVVDAGAVIGTGTIGIDAGTGLMADQIFKDDIDARRALGRHACELLRLAMEPCGKAREALAGMIHLATIYANIRGCRDAYIEVHPRHARLYERTFGFCRIGDARMNPRVNAPAVLLGIDLDRADKVIARFGGDGWQLCTPTGKGKHDSRDDDAILVSDVHADITKAKRAA